MKKMIFLFLLVSLSFGFECPISFKSVYPKKFNEKDEIFFNYIKTNKNFLELQKSCENGKAFSFCYHVENGKVFFIFDKKGNKHIFYDEKRAEKILFKESGKEHNFLNGLSENKATIEMPCTGNNWPKPFIK